MSDKKEVAPLKLKGTMEAWLTKENGDTEYHRKDNLIVDVGFDFISDAIGNSSRPAAMGWIEVGTGVTAPAAGDTTLQTPLLRKAATYAHTGGTKVFTFEATFNAGEATGAITEAGVFNAASVGTMLDRVTFSVINKAAGDSLVQKFTFTMS